MAHRFSIMLPTLVDPGEPAPYRRTLDFASLVDRLGFHMGTFAHHSFTPAEADPSAPFVVLGAVAARTERLRLGTGIYLAALHHPATVAEQAATLDQISGGRAVLGVAVGYRPYEFEGFGLDFTTRGRRLEESLQVIRRGWETGTYGHDGEIFRVPEVEVSPPCVQDPHVPILVGGSADAALSRAARLGDGWFALPQEALDQMARQVAFYRAECERAGRRPYVVLMRNAWIASDAATVADEWMGAMVQFHRTYSDARAAGESGDTVLERLLAGEDIGFEEYVAGRAIAGDPQMCIDEIRRWDEAVAPDEYSLIFGGSTEEQRLRHAVEQFAAEVMPAFV